jgi:hypothetical protein
MHVQEDVEGARAPLPVPLDGVLHLGGAGTHDAGAREDEEGEEERAREHRDVHARERRIVLG